MLGGTYDAGLVIEGSCSLRTRLDTVVPMLPDPYAANLSLSWRRMRELVDRGALAITVRWRAGSDPTVEVDLPDSSLYGLAPLARVERDRPGGAGRRIDGPVEVPAVYAAPTNALALLDLSSNADQFGVGVVPDSRFGTFGTVVSFRVAVSDGELVAPSEALFVLTPPAVQWDAVATPDDPAFPSPLTFPDNGGPTVLYTPVQALVPVSPRPALSHFVARFDGLNEDRPGIARFTLPYGIVAVARLRRAAIGGAGAFVDWNRPRFGGADLEGGHQITLTARGQVLPGGTPGLAGGTVQLINGLSNGIPTGRSVLGGPVEAVFNDNFPFEGTRPGVPITRADLSGYGESVFSDWRNPEDAAAVVSQVRFDVLVGRTAYEVVQVRTVCYPFGVRVVRTITIERRSTGMVARHDSGWVAASDGRYLFPSAATNPSLNPSPGIKTHPGVVRGIRDVTSIRDTGQVTTTALHGARLMAVRYHGVVELDGGPSAGVPVRDQIGWVQLDRPGEDRHPRPGRVRRADQRRGTDGWPARRRDLPGWPPAASRDPGRCGLERGPGRP